MAVSARRASRCPGFRYWLSAFGVVLVAFALAGCSAGAPDAATPTRPAAGPPRSFEMGFSSVPQDPSDESYKAVFQFAGGASDVILIQRAPPWAEFLPGATISARTEMLTRLEREQAKSQHLKLFLAIDPTDPADRGRLAALPDELRGRDFSDSRVRAAFIAYAKYLALNYKPAYLALGVEVDMFYRRRDDAAFRNFQSLYFEAYDAVKEVSPSTLVFPTFQYEDMLGLLSPNHSDQPLWPLVARFEPKIDLLAFSTFPGFVFGKAADIPANYYTQVQRVSKLPIAFVSVGWDSSGTDGAQEQATFLERALEDAQRTSARLFIWYLARDLTMAPRPGLDPLASSGLVGADDRPKPAFQEWRSWADRPIARPG